jgi:hypothetical protein
MESIEVGKQIVVNEVTKYNNSYYWYNVTVREYLGKYIKKMGNFYIFEDEKVDGRQFNELIFDSEPDMIMRVDDKIALEIIEAKKNIKITTQLAEEAYCKSAEADEAAYIAEKIAMKLEDSIIYMYNKTNK